MNAPLTPLAARVTAHSLDTPFGRLYQVLSQGLGPRHPALKDLAHVALHGAQGELPMQAEDPRVDPWELQAQIMGMSGQAMPPAPAITLSTLTYLALCAEELSETMTAVLDALDSTNSRQAASLFGVAAGMIDISKLLRQWSLHFREQLGANQHHKDVRVPLTAKAAAPVADGFTDMSVVVAGGALSTGIPGAECYLEVARSNISKAQDDGRIHLDPSGKWIKGPHYKPANLRGLLAQVCDDSAGTEAAHT